MAAGLLAVIAFLRASKYLILSMRNEDPVEKAGEHPPEERHLVFVSHDGRDTWVAKQIAREIRTAGADPFLDEAEVEVGGDFEERVLEFLMNAAELIVLLTPWALERPYVWAELGAAWGRRIPIVGVLYGMTAAELQARPGVPVFLKRRDLIDINDIDRYFGELAKRTPRAVSDPGAS